MAGGLAWMGPGLAIASGILVLLVGTPLLFVRSRRSHALAFGLFALVWGIQVVAGNVTNLVTSPELHSAITLVFLEATLVVYVPLAYFAASFTTPRGILAQKGWAAALLVAPAVLGTILLVAQPGLFVTGRGGVTTSYTTLYSVYGALFFASFVYALVALHLAASRASQGSLESRRGGLVLLALLAYVSFVSARTLVLFAGASPILLAASLAGAFACLFIGISTARARGVWILGVVALPAILGALWAVIPFETSGLVRIASAGLIAYAILRYELFDLDARVKRIGLATTTFLVAAVTLLGIELGIARATSAAGLTLTILQVALGGGLVVALVASPRAAERLGARVLPELEAPRRLDARRLEVYEAALAHSHASGGIEENAIFLTDLRARLGVGNREHALLTRLVVGQAQAAMPAAPGALIDARYRLGERLGEGSSGQVWLARDEKEGRSVVVKTLHPRLARSEPAARAFLREARLAASLDSPHVTRVLDFGQHGDAPFLVMELVAGGSLEERLARGSMTRGETVRILRGVLEGLAHLHARGVIHRDLKPANVLLTPDGEAKLADFGVASMNGEETSTGLEPPEPKGSFATMSPETLRGQTLTPATDIYAAGAILYRCLAGAPYLDLQGRTREAARAAILHEPPLALPAQSDAQLGAIAQRALEKAPDARYDSAAAMLAALDAPRVLA